MYRIIIKTRGITRTTIISGYACLSQDLKNPARPIIPPKIMVISTENMRGGCKANGTIPVTASMAMNTRQAKTVKYPTANAG